MSTTSYDFAIIGAGAAGLNLALAMVDKPYFKEKTILILDPDEKIKNDKTWSFWEKDENKLDAIVSKKWSKAVFTDRNGKSELLDLTPYFYKTIHALNFYTYAKKTLAQYSNVTWKRAGVDRIENEEIILTAETQYKINAHIFDSRISGEFHTDTSSIKLLQHFKAWVIETEKDYFDDSSFVMMDFNLIWKDTTSFTYVLPYSTKKALIEFTFFSPDLVRDEDYDLMIERYIKEYLNISEYIVSDVEKGVIPMSDYPFHKANSRKVTKIGTAGSWVKPSSGYSFRNAIHLSQQIVKNIGQGKPPAYGLLSVKHRFYDALFLDVLHSKNHLGPDLFASMYQRNKVRKIFKFLNEETSFPEDLKIMSTFPKTLFTKALLRKVF
ncbi:MAG: lycopene cyclase family protein [Bacteroidota bacterium]